MRAKEFIKESPGFDAGGTGSIYMPRGYNVPNQMYPTGARFSKQVTDFNVDPLDDNIMVHVERITQRIQGGMSKKEAIASYASQIAVDPKQLADLYNKHTSKYSLDLTI